MQHWQVCTVWRCSHRSVYEDVPLWVEPGLVLGPTLPGPITPEMGGDTMCSYNTIKEWGFGLTLFVGSLENCDHLAHYRPHVAASSDATAAVSQSAHAPTVWLSLISTHTSAHRVTRPARALSLYSLTLFNLLWLNSNRLEGCQVGRYDLDSGCLCNNL